MRLLRDPPAICRGSWRHLLRVISGLDCGPLLSELLVRLRTHAPTPLMPKLLRLGENVDFVQTRAPQPIWRSLKRAALEGAPDGTATFLCTNHMLDFLRERPWTFGMDWQTPKDITGRGGATGFSQVNLPLSNFDAKGHLIVSAEYLDRNGLLAVFGSSASRLSDAIASGKFRALVALAADAENVSASTFAYSFMLWLHGRLQQAPRRDN
jgi:hypothetical protein